MTQPTYPQTITTIHYPKLDADAAIPLVPRTDFVLIGSGFAGLATAYHLARRARIRILVVERETVPGAHASGRNAGLLRQSCDDPVLFPLLRDGLRAARRVLHRIPGAMKSQGSLIVGSGSARLAHGPRARMVNASSVVAGLKGRGLYDPEDGIIDPQALLLALQEGARRRGVEFSYGEEVLEIARAGGAVQGVRTSRRFVQAANVVIAAGAWSALLGDVPLVAKRRHLFRGRLAGADVARWPFVWNESEGVYFRPEGSELLLSPCDVEPHPPRAPEVDPAQKDALARKVERAFGMLGEWSIGAGWACLRTFAADSRFVIGPDGKTRGLWWVAGLGGHGMTAAWAVGRHAAEVMLGRRQAGPFDPRRKA